MTPWRKLSVRTCALVAACSLSAHAAGIEDSSTPAQVVGLFMQSCMRFVGDASGLRQWAARSGLRLLPEQGQRAFLYGLPGEVFDASSQDSKLVLISQNGGSCSALAESANGAAVISTLEQVMQVSHIDFTVTREGDDAVEKVLHHKEYSASHSGRRWQMLVSIVKGATAGEVMLTANP